MSMQTLAQAHTFTKPIVTPVSNGILPRACACGKHSGNRGECDECKKKRQGMLQRAARNSSSVNEIPPIVHDVLRLPGQPLDAKTRAFMEPRFGHDFSGVRVHTTPDAAESTKEVNALAYTVRQDIVFGPRQYEPHTTKGKRLLAHELTHVIQQDHHSTWQSTDDSPNSFAEQEAIQNADLILSGRPRITTNTTPMLSRQPAPGVGAPAGPPGYRDCTPAITGIADANDRLESSRQRARAFIGVAISRLNNAPAAGTTYETALQRHFIGPTAAERATIRATYQQIRDVLVVRNFICNSGAICGGEQAFWLPDDDLLHVCRSFWGQGLTCRAIILIHEGAHDVGIDDAPGAHGPNRGDPGYPAGNVAPPAAQATADRMNNADAYAFFAAHVWRNTDTGSECF